jgi:peptide/nickel transport system substrate-binding protein
VTLVRNPRFHEWSAAAQPAGYPDRIVVHLESDEAQPLPAAVVDRADWTTPMNTPDVAGLRARFGDRVRVSPLLATSQLLLNTTIRPFNDVRARRAVSFAIDRAAVLASWPFPGTVSCQLLPPTIPGYRPYCPYTLRPDATGGWHAPDLAAAQELVRRSGTFGAHVTLIAPAGQTAGFQPIVAALRQIGYDAHFRAIAGTGYFKVMPGMMASGRTQGGFAGWLADYPAASNFVQQQVTCASRSTLGGNNYALYCNPALDARVAAAAKQQQTSPATATTAWAAIDREVTDLAPYVPLLSQQRTDIVSTRVRHVLRNPNLGALYDQAWVR